MAIRLLACALYCCLAALANPSQHLFASKQPGSGVLRRFLTHDLNAVQKLLDVSNNLDLDVWQVKESHVDIYFPTHTTSLPSELNGFPHSETSIPGQDHRLDHVAQPASGWNLSSLENSTYHTSYHPQFEIDRFMLELAELFPEKVRIAELGHSGEGREMFGLVISSGPLSNGTTIQEPRREKSKGPIDPSKKLGFMVVGAQHAREWIATAASLYIAHALAANSSEPHSLASLLDVFDFYILPSPNPDGYEYTWESDRFWYKNRQIMGPNAKCVGLDMNRNWGYKWKPHAGQGPQPILPSSNSELESESKKKKGKKGKSPKPKPPVDPCSHWFPGHRAFESPEVNNMANYITTLPNLVAFVDLRSYGQMLSAPYSFSCKRFPKDLEDQMEAAMGAAQALRQVHGTAFTTGSLCELLYPAPGNMMDWAYARGGIKYSYAAHLRDTGTYGFALPPQWIRPVGEETGQMVSYLAKFLAMRLQR